MVIVDRGLLKGHLDRQFDRRYDPDSGAASANNVY